MGFSQQVISAFIGLIIGTLLGNELSRFLYKPRVVIKFKSLHPLFSNNGFFWSIIVANMGRTVATNCTGNITLFDIDEGDTMQEHEGIKDESLPRYNEEKLDLDFPRSPLITPNKFREIRNSSLCWSLIGNPEKMDINPGTTRGLDICRVQYHPDADFWYLIFPSERGWRKVRCRIKAKPIRGRIFVCPSNIFPKILDFEIRISRDSKPNFVILKYSLLKNMIRALNRRKLYFE